MSARRLVRFLHLLVVVHLSTQSHAFAVPPTKASAKKPASQKPAPRVGKAKVSSYEEPVKAAWTQFLGPGRDNRSPDTGLLKTWPLEGPRLVGTLGGLGIGFSNIAIADDIAYTMGNHGEREYVLALSLVSGERLWSYDNGPAYHNGYGDGPRGTPVIDGDRLYALGANGDLVCLDRTEGADLWHRNFLKDFGGVLPHWGIGESVLIDGDRVICTPGGNGATIVALNKMTGETVWKSASPQGDRAGYSSAIAVTVGGVRQFVQYTASSTIGVRAADGKFLWRDTSSANGTANCCAAVAVDDMVVTASGYAKGGSMLRLTSTADETTATLGWHSNDMQVQHGGLVLFAGHIYAANEQALVCVELKTGKMKWKARSVGKGSLTYADGRLVVRSEDGPIALVEATPEGYKELGRFIPPDRSGSKSWTYPVVASGKLLVRDQDLLLGYDLRGN